MGFWEGFGLVERTETDGGVFWSLWEDDGLIERTEEEGVFWGSVGELLDE